MLESISRRIVLLIALAFLPSSVTAKIQKEDLGEGVFIEKNMTSKLKSRIAIATVIISGNQQEVSENFQQMTYVEGVALGTKSKRLYARRHGYDFIVATQKLDTCYGHGEERPLECAWTKLALVSRILKDYDWVFWTDADSVILNFETKLEDFLNPDYDIIACSERTGFLPFPYSFIDGGFVNTGEVFYKNSDFSKFVIEETWKIHKKKTPGQFEQWRLNTLIKSLPEQDQNRVLVCPASAFNASAKLYQEGDFMLHLYAYHGKELYEKFKEIEEQYGWIIDVEETRQKFFQKWLSAN